MKKLTDLSLEIADLETMSVMGYKCCMYGNHTVLVEWHKGLLEFSRENVRFSLGRSSVSVVGKGLEIAMLTKSSAVVKGEISGVDYHGV